MEALHADLSERDAGLRSAGRSAAESNVGRAGYVEGLSGGSGPRPRALVRAYAP